MEAVGSTGRAPAHSQESRHAGVSAESTVSGPALASLTVLALAGPAARAVQNRSEAPKKPKDPQMSLKGDVSFPGETHFQHKNST